MVDNSTVATGDACIYQSLLVECGYATSTTTTASLHTQALLGLYIGDEAPQYGDADKDFAHDDRLCTRLEEACDVLGNFDGHRDAAYDQEGVAVLGHGDVEYQCDNEAYEK